MINYQIELKPLSSFQSFPASDTLFGAICWGIKRLYGMHGNKGLQNIMEKLSAGSPDFIVSSAFPLLKPEKGDSIFFYPRPITSGLKIQDIQNISRSLKTDNAKKSIVEVISKYKKFKKVEYFSQPIFESFLSDGNEMSLFERYLNDTITIVNHMLMTEGEEKTVWNTPNPKTFNTAAVQKNSIDRITMSTDGTGQTFYFPEIYTSDKFSLYFLLKTDDIGHLEPVFRYLEDKGIGANRSTGKGRFKIRRIGEKTCDENSNAKMFITLSRFIPTNEDINWESNKNSYEIFPYRSKVDSDGEFRGENIWKSRVMYIKEGSCLEIMKKNSCYGNCPVVKKIGGQSIRQNGIAFPVFVNFGDTQ
ncbi:MAG: type III-A CRISPR-associated RAMP protein Csm4 [Planctomycetia bacterium]|uniref:type III-A CRISPR-associated RAMP protein Csm4 n=1 Tax=Candidatus Kuenenia sp. TaxID=2499824 RepID=UPI001D704AAC|nr:type III-A CRISPR-associated RAMP protein Csm4 [Planctomycetia bacterium]MCL4743608.1 type III-A CRISPR-associated RAMP protein Csm4 [Phycisphaerales bacterium]